MREAKRGAPASWHRARHLNTRRSGVRLRRHFAGGPRAMKTSIFAGALIASLALQFPAAAATIYTYDTLGRVSTVTYDNGMVITYSYDPAGNRTQVVTAP
jgi:YD repeat-containing protein